MRSNAFTNVWIARTESYTGQVTVTSAGFRDGKKLAVGAHTRHDTERKLLFLGVKYKLS